jgi:uncharacterized protein (TIGR03067 family)
MPNGLAKLQGAWTLTTLHMDGREFPASGRIEIAGDRFKSIGMGAEYAGNVELDDTKKPARFDLVFTEGPEAGNRNLGIYQVNGDSWKLCLNTTGKSRPRSFAANPGSGNALEIFTRGSATADTPDEPLAAEGEGELVGEWEMQAAFQEGNSLDASMVKTGRRVTSATHTTTYFGKQVFLNAAYTIDTTTRPKTIDLDNRGKKQLGIFEVEGDTMKICFAAPARPRPTDFESRSGDGNTAALWKKLSV